MTTAAIGSCCVPPTVTNYKPTFYDQLLDTCLKVSVVVLGVLTAISSFQSFMITFAVGVALGLYQGWRQRAQARVLASGNFCTQGFIELATGVKLPAEVHLVINIAMTADHLVGHHKSEAYSMLMGIYLGTWFGNELARKVSWLIPR